MSGKHEEAHQDKVQQILSEHRIAMDVTQANLDLLAEGKEVSKATAKKGVTTERNFVMFLPYGRENTARVITVKDLFASKEKFDMFKGQWPEIAKKDAATENQFLAEQFKEEEIKRAAKAFTGKSGNVVGNYLAHLLQQHSEASMQEAFTYAYHVLSQEYSGQEGWSDAYGEGDKSDLQNYLKAIATGGSAGARRRYTEQLDALCNAVAQGAGGDVDVKTVKQTLNDAFLKYTQDAEPTMQANMQARLQRFVTSAQRDTSPKGKKIQSFLDELQQDMQKRDVCDFEVLGNFKAGVSLISEDGRTLQDGIKHNGAADSGKQGFTYSEIINAGKMYRVRKALAEDAASLQNPFHPGFDKLEEKLAGNVANALTEDELRAAKNVDAYVMFTDKETLTPFFKGSQYSEFCSIPAYGVNIEAVGEASTPRIAVSKIFSTDDKSIEGTIDHEAKHMFDMRSPKNIVSQAQLEADLLVTSAQAQVSDVISFINDPRNEISDLFGMLKNGDSYQGKDHKQKLINALTEIEDRIAVLSSEDMYVPAKTKTEELPWAEERREKLLKLTEDYQGDMKTFEFPAVVSELQQTYGQEFIDAVMPNLSEAITKHNNDRLQEAMPKASASR